MRATFPATRGRAVSVGATSSTTLQAVGATLIAVAVAVFVVGTAWDTQWHVAVGRDKVLTAPHQMMLAGITVAGLVSLALVLWQSWRARATGAVGEGIVSLLGLFYAPLGIFVAGFGALIATIAFGLDDYWHTLYGIDVTLWAPFHVMIVGGVGMIGLGALYALAALRNRAEDGPARMALEVAYAVALAVVYSDFLLLLPQANAAEGLARIGSYEFALYPVLLSFSLPLALLPAISGSRLPVAATLVALTVVLLRQVMMAFVPWAVEATRAAEGLVYRPDPPSNVITPYAFPTAIVLAGLVLDATVWLLRGRRGSGAALVAITALLSALVPLWDRPWATALPEYYYPDMNVSLALTQALPFVAVAVPLGVGAALLVARGLRTVRS